MREEEAAILHGKILGFSGAEPKSARLWHNGTTARLAGVMCWQKNVLWDLGREILLGRDSWRFGFCYFLHFSSLKSTGEEGEWSKPWEFWLMRKTEWRLLVLGQNSHCRTFQLFFSSPTFSCSSLLQLRRTVPRYLIIPAGKIVNYFLLWITCIPGRTGSCLIFLASYHLPTEGNVAGTCPGRSVEPAVKSLQGRDSSPFQE